MVAAQDWAGCAVVGSTVRGASHVRADLPNQDALRWLPASGVGVPVIVAVADGHGSAKCFRSDRGSLLAVLTATETLAEFLAGEDAAPTLTAVKRLAEETLPQRIVRRWQEAVEADLAHDPVTEAEWARLAEREGAATVQRVAEKPLLVYGATVLAALVTREYLLFLQLGDGDILTVSDGLEVQRPLPGDRRLFANETTSLSGKHAWRDFRVAFQALSGPPPALVLLTTDGYPNSFRDDQGFLQVGADLVELIRADGLDAVRANLEVWLTEASAAGSGDDITVALVWREDGGAGNEERGTRNEEREDEPSRAVEGAVAETAA